MAQAFTLSFYLIKIRKFLSIYYIHRIQQFFSLSNFVAAWCQNMNIWAEKIKQIVVEMLVKVFFFYFVFLSTTNTVIILFEKTKNEWKRKEANSKKAHGKSRKVESSKRDCINFECSICTEVYLHLHCLSFISPWRHMHIRCNTPLYIFTGRNEQ